MQFSCLLFNKRGDSTRYSQVLKFQQGTSTVRGVAIINSSRSIRCCLPLVNFNTKKEKANTRKEREIRNERVDWTRKNTRERLNYDGARYVYRGKRRNKAKPLPEPIPGGKSPMSRVRK